jgi:hypothetical protein
VPALFAQHEAKGRNGDKSDCGGTACLDNTQGTLPPSPLALLNQKGTNGRGSSLVLVRQRNREQPYGNPTRALHDH